MPENAKRSKSPPFMEFESILNVKFTFRLKRNHCLLANLLPMFSFLVKVTVDFGVYFIVFQFITAI